MHDGGTRSSFFTPFWGAAIALATIAALSGASYGASFTAGDIVVYRVGDGSVALTNSGNPVFIDEYAPSGGSPVQSISIGIYAQGSTGSGSAIEGLLSNSADGQYVVLAGYANTVSSGNLSAAACGTNSGQTNRVAGLVKYDGTVDTSTVLTDFSCSSNPRSATSSDGVNIWVGGNGSGARYTTLGSTSSTLVSTGQTNVRQLSIFGGKLYAAINAINITDFGTSLPTSGDTATTLTGLTNSGTSPDGFFFATLPGGTVLYIADDTAGVIHKWSLVSGTWTDSGTISYSGARAVVGTVSGSTVTLYLNNGGSTISTLADTSGFNAMITGTVTSWVTAPSNETFRGIALAPVAPATPTATSTSTRTITPGGPTFTVTRTITSTLPPTATTTPTGPTPTFTPTALPFASGDVVVYRVGDGTGALTTGVGEPVFLDEYTSAGVLVQSVPMPTTASGSNQPLVASGAASTEGQLSQSSDGRYLLLTGYDAAVGVTGLTTSLSAAVPRTVGRVAFGGGVDTSTALTDFCSGDKPRGATSDNGTNLWLSCGKSATGTSVGVHYTTLGSTTSIQLSTTATDSRQVNVFGGQLYVSTQDISGILLGTVGTGAPTMSPQTITSLPGLTSSGKPNGFFFASLTGAGIDTLYVADETAGVQKWSLVGGAWLLNNAIAPASDTLYGVTGSANGTTVTLYATGNGSGTTGKLYSFTDASGYNSPMSGTLTTLVTAASNKTFRGVALAPMAFSTPTKTITAGGPTLTVTPTPTRTQIPTSSATLTAAATQTPSAPFTSTPTPTATPASFITGDVVVYRVGDGSTSLQNGVGVPVFLDEYTSAGVLVQSVPLPTTDSLPQHALVASGTAGTEGQLTRSTDARYLLLTGYDATIGSTGDTGKLTTSTAAAVPRIVGRVDFTGAIDTTTALTDFADGDKPRSATSTTGTDLWLTCGGKATGTTGSIHYTTLGGMSSIQLSSTFGDGRAIGVFSGQLYISSQNNAGALIAAVGSGTPSSAPQATSPIAGYPPTNSPEGFFFTTLNGGAGPDTLYIADEGAGIQKWSLISGSWQLNNTITPASDKLYGLAGVTTDTTVTLYATGSGPNNDKGTLYTLIDTSGFNAPINGTLASLAVAPANQAFRGVALAPESSGLAPTNTDVGKCEDSVATNLRTLAACVMTCGKKQAGVALAIALKGTGTPFDEAGCEATCRATYNKTSSALLNKLGSSKQPLCPTCLGQAAQTGLADQAMNFMELLNGQAYCAGTTSLGNAKPGFVPPDKNASACEDKVSANLSTLTGCLVKCQIRQADAIVANTSFDQDACIQTTCRAAYDKTSTAELGKKATVCLDSQQVKAPICPACLDTDTQGALADRVLSFVRSLDGQVYCSGAAALPTPAP